MSSPSTLSLDETVKLRFEEYNNVIEQTAKLSDRRQTINDIFVGINSLFLTGLGYLFTTLQLTNWYPTALFGAVAVLATLMNVTWRRLNENYRILIEKRLGYARQIESGLQSFGLLADSHLADGKKMPTFGVLHQEDSLYGSETEKPRIRFGFSVLEQGLIRVFRYSYLVLVAIVAGLTYAISNGYLPPLFGK